MDLNLNCHCKRIKGIARNINPARTGRIICLCDDCQAYARYLDNKEVLDENGGTEVIPLYPSDIEFIEGKDLIKCVRLMPGRGLYRWYAGCCNAPLVNLPSSPKIPYAGVLHTFVEGGKPLLEEKFGKVKGRINGRFGKGELPAGTSQKVSWHLMVTTIIPFILIGKLKKKHSPSPFFTEDGISKCRRTILTKQEVSSLKR